MSVDYRSNIYFKRLLKTRDSGLVSLRVPIIGYKDPYLIEGILEDDIRIKTENKWGTLVPSLDSLSQLSQLFTNDSNIISWVNGSSAAWESTAPIDVQLQMRLITFNSSEDILKQMTMLQSLTALHVSGALTVQAHGGYINNFWKPNDLGFWTNRDNLNGGKEELKTTNPFTTDNGTVTLSFGNITIFNLLAQTIDATVSKILCRNHQPLWIKISMNLRGVKALIIQELQRMVPDSGLSGGDSTGGTPVPEPEAKPTAEPEYVSPTETGNNETVARALQMQKNASNPNISPWRATFYQMTSHQVMPGE